MSSALDSLARLRSRCARGGPHWLTERRSAAWEAFVEADIPTRRLEAWKSTNLAPLAALEFAQIETPAARVDATGARVRSLSEILSAEPDRLAGRLGRLADPKRNALVALATACLEEVVVVELSQRSRTNEPIRIRFDAPVDPYGGVVASFPRLLVRADSGSEATILVEFAGESAPGFTACVAELMLEADARVELVCVQAERAPRIHFTSVHAELERGARLASHAFTSSDALVRSELDLRLAAPGAEAVMNGFFLGHAAGHVDHYTTVDHAAPHCTSAQEYRGVLADRAKGVFRGRVVVRPGAQKTNASQSNPNLLLSESASIDTRPQLEIYADDVKASHGSTIGQLDPEALFFLRARGIDESEARMLLTRGFAQAIVEGIGSSELREEMAQRIEAALAPVAAPMRDADPGAGR